MDLQLDNKPLLRPAQLADALDEKKALEKKLESPNIQDKGEVARQLRRVSAGLRDQTPTPFSSSDIDKATALEAELREQILDGMPSHEEMRKAPPGAVEKHQAWEARTKHKMGLWKNLMLRLNAGSSDGSVANFEKYRPRTSTLNMDNAQIQGKQFFMPETSGPAVIFNDNDIATLRKHAPDIALKLPLLNNEQRAEVKQILRSFQEEAAA